MLTEQEKKILKLILKGYSEQAIAKKLNNSYNTIRTHIYNISKKLCERFKGTQYEYLINEYNSRSLMLLGLLCTGLINLEKWNKIKSLTKNTVL